MASSLIEQAKYYDRTTDQIFVWHTFTSLVFIIRCVWKMKGGQYKNTRSIILVAHNNYCSRPLLGSVAMDM